MHRRIRFLAVALAGFLAPSSALHASVQLKVYLHYHFGTEDTIGVGKENTLAVNTPTIQLRLTEAATELVTVQWSTSSDNGATAAADGRYKAKADTAIFPIGVTSVDIPIELIDDSEAQVVQWAWIELSNPVNATLDPDQAKPPARVV